MRAIFSLALCLTLCLAAAGAQSPALQEGIEKALELHDAATDLGGEMRSVEALEKLAEEHPDHWLPPYWASFVLTQASMSAGDPVEVLKLADRAQDHYDRAWDLKSDKSKRDLADLYTLQSLIHGFKSGAYFRQGKQQEGIKHTRLRSRFLDKAVLAEPGNPRVYVLKGTSLISQGTRNKSAADVLAGRVLLEQAKMLYQDFKTESAISPDWSRPWIDFWLENRAKLPEPDESGSSSG